MLCSATLSRLSPCLHFVPYKGLKEELNITTQRLAHLETRQEDLEYDIDNLVNLIGNARATGKWEVRNGVCLNINFLVDPLLDFSFLAPLYLL